MMTDLSGKIALVTGASRGIGRAIALALARAGADVAVNYRSRQSEAEEVRSQIEACGRRSIAVGADVSSAGEVSALVEAVQKDLGAVSILVNNAAITRTQSLPEITEKDWDEIIAVNLKSHFLTIQAVLRGCARKWGRSSTFPPWPRNWAGSWGLIMPLQGGDPGADHSYASCWQGRDHGECHCPGLILTEMIANPRKPNLLSSRWDGSEPSKKSPRWRSCSPETLSPVRPST